MKDYQSVGAIICGFYINYEECKYSKQPFQHSIILSFILTMRNVNVKPFSPLAPGSPCFILTMRNVNWVRRFRSG